MSVLCRHDLEYVDKHVFDPPIKIARDNGAKTIPYYDGDMFTQKVCWIYKCSKCGKLRKVESVLRIG